MKDDERRARMEGKEALKIKLEVLVNAVPPGVETIAGGAESLSRKELTKSRM
ncbi:hypothetical protein ABIB06_004258 [Bradyrhizobium sp. LB8.2]|jgi:hypothetical protein|uniref:hypothetical protein n=1 Tax=unclassified Bradyrhizobium TaxID=2631580 RepID=UPI003393F578